VRAFLDTSVLVATFYADREHDPPRINLFLRLERKDACCGAHSLAEVYAAPQEYFQVAEASAVANLASGAI
jgi:hypothetical protein